ncbi:MAG: hypothetical protein MJZ34_02905 [Paludibacteraceae bacterium]|nr:hypothetical protein [Paludibacteraceae bacterium]
MPFFYDIFNDNPNSIPDYMIPYSQALYYDATENKIGAENYQLLFVTPFNGQPQERFCNIDIVWNHSDIDFNSDIRTVTSNVQNRELQAIARQVEEDLQRWSSYDPNVEIDSEDYKRLSENLAKLSVLGVGTWQLPTDLIDKLKQKGKTAIDAKRMLQGMLSSVRTAVGKESQKETEDSSVHLSQGSAQAKLNANGFQTIFNGANVTSSVSSEGLSITKTLVCKSSDAISAYECIEKLAQYLSIVAPFWYYEVGKDQSWSRANMRMRPPNDFYADIVGPQQFAASATKTSVTDKSWDVFKYRGQFQLRKGYTIYRNLVPKNVKVVASQDNVLLDSSPFDKFNEPGFKSLTDITENKDNKAEFFSYTKNHDYKRIIESWKNSGLYQSINDGVSKKYLFPQYINLEVTLVPIEPLDGVTGTQQLFCYSKDIIKRAQF